MWRAGGEHEQPASQRAGHTVVAASIPWRGGTHAMIVFGGYADGETTCDAHLFFPLPPSAVGPLGRWERLDAVAVGEPPAPRAMHAAAMLGDTMVVHGGWGGGDVLRGDTCTLHLSGDQPHWEAPSERLVVAPDPPARQGHTLVGADGCADVLLFGGDTGAAVTNELWSLSFLADGALRWERLRSTGRPPRARSGHVACALRLSSHAGTTHHMLISGGRGGDGACLGDVLVLAWEGRQWSEPKVRLPERRAHAARSAPGRAAARSIQRPAPTAITPPPPPRRPGTAPPRRSTAPAHHLLRPRGFMGRPQG